MEPKETNTEQLILIEIDKLKKVISYLEKYKDEVGNSIQLSTEINDKFTQFQNTKVEIEESFSILNQDINDIKNKSNKKNKELKALFDQVIETTAQLRINSVYGVENLHKKHKNLRTLFFINLIITGLLIVIFLVNM